MGLVESKERQLKLRKPGRQHNDIGESTSPSEDANVDEADVALDAVNEAVVRLRTARLLTELSPSEDANVGDADAAHDVVNEAVVRLRTARLLTELSNMPGSAIEGGAGVEEVGASAEDEARFLDAVSDPERWGASQSSSGSSSPGSAGNRVCSEPNIISGSNARRQTQGGTWALQEACSYPRSSADTLLC